jgi:hypothetical protein
VERVERDTESFENGMEPPLSSPRRLTVSSAEGEVEHQHEMRLDRTDAAAAA